MNARVSSPLLVGRQREREHLRRVLERAAGGEMLLVTVGGDPGVGKTRLVLDMAGTAAGLFGSWPVAAWTSVTARCRSGRSWKRAPPRDRGG